MISAKVLFALLLSLMSFQLHRSQETHEMSESHQIGNQQNQLEPNMDSDKRKPKYKSIDQVILKQQITRRNAGIQIATAASNSQNFTVNNTKGKPGPNISISKSLLALKNINGVYRSEYQNTGAIWGDRCTPTDATSTDYCEEAEYPQKGKMFCYQSGPNHTDYTCVCKFGRKIKNKEEYWEQLRYDATENLCLSPEGGRCYEKEHYYVGNDKKFKKSGLNNASSKAHKQCDNTGMTKKEDILRCARAHPRRFVSFNEHQFYCLKEKDRATKHSGASIQKSLIFHLQLALIILSSIVLN